MAQRVWERFLTEQDRAHLAARPSRRRGFGEKPALLLIDLYRWVYGDKPESILEAIKKWPSHCGLDGWNAIPPIQKLLARAREVGIPVVHTTGLDGAGVAPRSHRREAELQADRDPEAQDRLRHRYDIIDEVKPLPGETVIRKASPSAFWGTPLIGHLNSLHVDTLITCGESTSGCVRASVVDGCTYRFHMVVVEEGVFDRHQTTHAMNLFDMNQKYADVLPLQEVLDYLDAWHTRQRGSQTKAASNAPLAGETAATAIA
jgi:nicotinamidase-related amidase